MLILFFFLLGLIIGSFLYVVVLRLDSGNRLMSQGAFQANISWNQAIFVL